MGRKLNKIDLEPGAACMHCDHVFERPYDRQPEIEGTSGKIVLKCQHCGLFTVFEEAEGER